MELTQIKTYLDKELPDFEFVLGTETPHEANWNSILVSREGQTMPLDVSKVDNKRALTNLKAFIESQWNKVVQ